MFGKIILRALACALVATVISTLVACGDLATPVPLAANPAATTLAAPTTTALPVPTATVVPPTATSQPTAIPDSTATATPTAKPLPTSTPVPATATPVPATATSVSFTAKPGVTVGGIGVSRTAVKKEFETQGFIFAENRSNNGAPYFIGQHSPWLVQLIGPEEDLSNAALVFVARPNDTLANTHSVMYLQAFERAVIPQWSGFEDWVAANMEKAASDGQTSTTYKGLKIVLLGLTASDGAVLTLSVEKP